MATWIVTMLIHLTSSMLHTVIFSSTTGSRTLWTNAGFLIQSLFHALFINNIFEPFVGTSLLLGGSAIFQASLPIYLPMSPQHFSIFSCIFQVFMHFVHVFMHVFKVLLHFYNASKLILIVVMLFIVVFHILLIWMLL